MFIPAGLMLDEKSSNWNAIEHAFGCKFMERCISCEFHFKQSINRKMKDSMFTNSEDREKFRNLTRKILEVQTEIQFKTAVTNLESFITEKKERNLLSEWFKWWLARKEHIFRAFKDRECPKSNLSELIHSSWVTTKRTHMTLYEATIDDIVEHVTIKQILKPHGDGGFGGGTGPNFKELEAQKLARKERVSSQITASNDDAINIYFSQQQQQKHYDIDSDDGWSPPQKRKGFCDLR